MSLRLPSGWAFTPQIFSIFTVHSKSNFSFFLSKTITAQGILQLLSLLITITALFSFSLERCCCLLLLVYLFFRSFSHRFFEHLHIVKFLLTGIASYLICIFLPVTTITTLVILCPTRCAYFLLLLSFRVLAFRTLKFFTQFLSLFFSLYFGSLNLFLFSVFFRLFSCPELFFSILLFFLLLLLFAFSGLSLFSYELFLINLVFFFFPLFALN